MATLNNKIDFVVLVSANQANVNGDPLNGNRPRTDYSGYGEMSDVCIKRKIRNRMQDLGNNIFVQSADRCKDGYKSLSDRAAGNIKVDKKDTVKYAEEACKKWLDVRAFGQVFAFSSQEGLSVGVRGPVTIHHSASVSPIEIRSYKIVKSVNGDPPKKSDKSSRSSDTMGDKYFVQFGLYEIKGSINVQLAEKTGFSEEDADIIKECLRTLFLNDASSARPEGSMEVLRVYWWKHNCKDGQYSSSKVHRSVHVELKPDVNIPSSADDYIISVDELPGLEQEIIEGV